MDLDKIKERLAALRPDGLDLDDPEVAELLALVEEDLELAEWFAQEQVFDQAFAEKLATIQPPEGLDERIVQAMQAAQPTDGAEAEKPVGEAPATPAPVVAFPATSPPEASSASAESKGTAIPFCPREKTRWWQNPSIISAAAAVVLLLGFTLILLEPQPLAADSDLSGFYDHMTEQHLGAPALDARSDDLDELRRHLAAQGAPIPGILPPAIDALPEVGCTVTQWEDAVVSIVRMGEDGSVSLFIAEARALPAALDDDPGPSYALRGPVAILAWAEGAHLYFLVGPENIHDLLL